MSKRRKTRTLRELGPELANEARDDAEQLGRIAGRGLAVVERAGKDVDRLERAVEEGLDGFGRAMGGIFGAFLGGVAAELEKDPAPVPPPPPAPRRVHASAPGRVEVQSTPSPALDVPLDPNLAKDFRASRLSTTDGRVRVCCRHCAWTSTVLQAEEVHAPGPRMTYADHRRACQEWRAGRGRQ